MHLIIYHYSFFKACRYSFRYRCALAPHKGLSAFLYQSIDLFSTRQEYNGINEQNIKYIYIECCCVYIHDTTPVNEHLFIITNVPHS